MFSLMLLQSKPSHAHDQQVSSRIFCLGGGGGGGGKNSLESLNTPTFVGILYWHVINLFCTTLGY